MISKLYFVYSLRISTEKKIKTDLNLDIVNCLDKTYKNVVTKKRKIVTMLN